MRVLFFLLITFSLFGDLPNASYDPHAHLHHSINIATGYYQEYHTDLVVSGAEPISIPRYHTSSKCRPHLGTFDFPYEHIITRIGPQTRPHEITLRTTSGLTTGFAPQIGAGYGHHAPKQWTATCMGPSGYTHSGSGKSYLINWHLIFRRAKGYYFELKAGDGERRFYTRCGARRGYRLAELHLNQGDIVEEFALRKIVRPNGNRIHYTYDDSRRLIKIHATDPTEAETLTWVIFSYRGDSWDVTRIQTSDGQDIRYTYEDCYGKILNKHHQFLLTKVIKNGELIASYNYDNHRITKQSKALGNYLSIHYRLNNKRSIEHKEHNLLCVESLSAPVGSDGKEETVARFEYHHAFKGYGWTDAYDGEGNLTRYHFTPYPDHRINLIEHFQGTTPIYNDVYTWDYSLLTGHYLTTPEGIACSAKTFEYDTSGNVIRETTYGITGAQLGYLAVKPIYSQKASGHPTTKVIPVGTPEGLIKTYTYSNDGYNNLLSETCDNIKICYTYHPDTDLIATKEAYVDGKLQNSEAYTYNGCGQLISHTFSDTFRTRTEEIVYENGLPVTRIDPLKTTRYTYSDRHFCTAEEVDVEGECLVHQNTYDSSGRPTSHTDPLGQVTRTAYDKVGRPILHVTPTTQTETLYDLADRPIQKTQSDGIYTLIAHTTYDLLGNPIAAADPNGNTTHTTYNFRGQPLTRTDPLGHTTTYTYDALGNCISTTDPLGHTTHTTYNVYGKPLTITYPDDLQEVFIYDKQGHLHTHTDPTGVITTYTRDYKGRPLTITTLEKQTIHTYQGEVLASTRHPDGSVTIYTYNDLGQLISEDHEGTLITYAYDDLGRRVQVTGIESTRITYDLLDRPISTESPTQTLETAYDYDGNIISQKDPYGTKTATYCLLGLTSETDPLGHTTCTTYDLAPFTITTSDPCGYQTITTHDSHGRPTSIEKPSLLTTYTYDPCGRPLTECHNEYLLSYTYDPCGRPLTLTENSSRTTRYTYERGRLMATHKPSGISLTQTYDGYGRLQTHSGPDFSDTYAYDFMDRILTVTSSEGITTRAYNIRGHLTSEMLETGHTLHYDPDPYGRIERVILPDQSVIDYTYDGSHIASLTRGSYTFGYTYDRLGRLIETSSPIQSTQTTYDPCGRPLIMTAPSFSQDLTYDACGNLTNLETIDPGGTHSHTYTYDPLSQLASQDGVSCAHNSLGNKEPTDAYNQLLSRPYDEDGNPTDYTYDSRGRLISACGERYTYDPFHRRLSKNDLHYLYMGDNLVGAISDNKLIELRPLGPGLGAEIGAAPLFELGQETYFPLYDHRGSTVVLLSSWNYVKEVYRYDAFGNTSIFGAWGLSHVDSFNPYQFLSKYADDTGFIYFGRRYYVPSEGRWLTPDPSGHADGPNLYAYCGNNPLTLLDLYGLIAVDQSPSDWGSFRSNVGSAIEKVSFHFPSPFREEWLMAGAAMQGKSINSELFSEASITRSSRGDYPDLGPQYSLCNGILNTNEEVASAAEYLSQKCFHQRVYYTTNPTQGMGNDVMKAFINRLHISTHEVYKQRKSIWERYACHLWMQSQGFDSLMIFIPHSRGVCIFDLALNGIPKHVRDHIWVYAFAAPYPIKNDKAARVVNIVASKDGVCTAGRCFGLIPYNPKHYNVVHLESPKDCFPFTDHLFLGSTYGQMFKTIDNEVNQEIIRRNS